MGSRRPTERQLFENVFGKLLYSWIQTQHMVWWLGSVSLSVKQTSTGHRPIIIFHIIFISWYVYLLYIVLLRVSQYSREVGMPWYCAQCMVDVGTWTTKLNHHCYRTLFFWTKTTPWNLKISYACNTKKIAILFKTHFCIVWVEHIKAFLPLVLTADLLPLNCCNSSSIIIAILLRRTAKGYCGGPQRAMSICGKQGHLSKHDHHCGEYSRL